MSRQAVDSLCVALLIAVTKRPSSSRKRPTVGWSQGNSCSPAAATPAVEAVTATAVKLLAVAA
jgi:hypothetical protein